MIDAPPIVNDAFNEFTSGRTVYGRLHTLLKIIHDKNPSAQQLRGAVHKSNDFILARSEEGTRHISSTRIADYLEFLRRARWIIQPNGRFQTTEEGRLACDDMYFNRRLLAAIEEQVLPEDFSLSFLDQIIKVLLDNMIPPTPVRIKERAAMNGKVLQLDQAVRVALQVLPSTGRYLKGSSDAIYPAET